MTEQPQPPTQGRHRHRQDIAVELDRMTVVAEAKVLVRQLDQYLEIMGDWVAGGMEGADNA